MKNVGETAGPGSVLPSLASWLLGWPHGHTRCCPRPLSPRAGAAFRPVCWLKPNPRNLQAGTEGVPPIPRLGKCGWDSSPRVPGMGLAKLVRSSFLQGEGVAPLPKPLGDCAVSPAKARGSAVGTVSWGARDHSVSLGDIISSQTELACPRSSAPSGPAGRLAGACAAPLCRLRLSL